MLNEALLKIAHIQSHHIRKPLASIMGLMNLIKDNNYEADKELLMKMDAASLQLDKRIREVIIHAETDQPNEI
jgi:signal transduction histidine kinase